LARLCICAMRAALNRFYQPPLILAAVLLMSFMSQYFMWLPADVLIPLTWLILYAVAFLLVAFQRRWLLLLSTGAVLLLLLGVALTIAFNFDDEGFAILLLFPSPIGLFTGMLAASTMIGARALRLRWVKAAFILPLIFAGGIWLWFWLFV
jgi:hypothetical protein